MYKTHIEPLKEQLRRYPYPFPQLQMNPDVTEIEKFKFEDFKLINYTAHPRIKMEMAV